MFRSLAFYTVFFLSLSFVDLLALQARAQDWPALRGANGYGTVTTDGILATTSAVELKTRWKRKLGSGYSSIVVSGDRVITMYTDGTDDLVVCLNAKTGETIWQTKTNPIFKGENGSFDGPISTPVIFESKVFAFSATGQLFCLALILVLHF